MKTKELTPNARQRIKVESRLFKKFRELKMAILEAEFLLEMQDQGFRIHANDDGWEIKIV